MSHEFKVVLDGIDLPDRDVQALNRAVQHAVMEALASLQIPERVCVHFPPCGPEGICGIIIRHDPDHPVPKVGEAL
jgi:hypothetical protein